MKILQGCCEQATVKPFVKWAGGKGQLLREIQKVYPNGLGTIYTKYAEPFVGGGAVLFDILNRYELEDIYISDINRELITTYAIIRDKTDQLIDLLTTLQEEYIPLDTENRKEYYYHQRERFNSLKRKNWQNNLIEGAALFIFLNKTCFNGLYRVNQKGFFNVPMGSYKKPTICDTENLRRLAKKMQKVTTIVCADYRKSQDFIDSKTFVYFDPPYRPLSETASFTSYTEQSFDDTAQKELASFVDLVTQKGAMVVVSNSDPKNYNIDDDFFDALYFGHNINRIVATRMINCNSKARGEINELLITNF
ncbi:MAG: DNA adenine methylase [Planctomycetaceae bacterium]|jgi:DNA adenine methylase|nr:DNA adenine methylase [Planctomycetaceae bacterium]